MSISIKFFRRDDDIAVPLENVHYTNAQLIFVILEVMLYKVIKTLNCRILKYCSQGKYRVRFL